MNEPVVDPDYEVLEWDPVHHQWILRPINSIQIPRMGEKPFAARETDGKDDPQFDRAQRAKMPGTA